MNRFVIQEDDQFEIHIKEVKIEDDRGKRPMSGEATLFEKHIKNAAQEVMLKAQQGSGLYHL